MSESVRPALVGYAPSLRLRAWWALIKSLQSALLLVTGVAGYVSGCCLNLSAAPVGAMAGSLLLTIAGSTVFNMVLDRDIDALMRRTASRPLPAGVVSVTEATVFGAVLTVAGVAWAFWLLPLYGWLVAAGWFLDVVVYTMLLKRRSASSILIGGLAGGMPILAGRALATGTVDLTGVLLAAGVLLWIPLHIVTFAISNRADYDRAGIPTIPARYGDSAARLLIAPTTVLSAGAFLAAAWLLALPGYATAALAAGAIALTAVTLAGLARPGRALERVAYKGASVYMLAVMVAIIVAGY